ncbi:hypothetical protein SS50377_24900 [Spironucleus salmonicida]|uniref:Uncharacterized protein n=1 Tax=Spironucleus salmonicida TaxID=348837 RepID=A0A9P8LRM4_9EUKA|nr:hypothetical protein SS50377_24900 [Spironucleus salmonicida]
MEINDLIQTAKQKYTMKHQVCPQLDEVTELRKSLTSSQQSSGKLQNINNLIQLNQQNHQSLSLQIEIDDFKSYVNDNILENKNILVELKDNLEINQIPILKQSTVIDEPSIFKKIEDLSRARKFLEKHLKNDIDSVNSEVKQLIQELK